MGERSNSAKAPTKGEHMAIGGVLTREDQARLDELHPHSLAGGALDEGTKVIEVPGEPVRTVHDHGVPTTGEPQQLRKLCLAGPPPEAFSVNTRSNLAIELALLVLVEGAPAHVPDPLFGHCCSPLRL